MSPTQASSAAEPPTIRVLTHNVMFLPKVVADYATETRADLIASSDYIRGHDVVVLEEMFDDGPSDRLLAKLADQYPYRTPVLGRSRSGWDQTAGQYQEHRPEDGGVVVLSKWPIRQRVQYIYGRACGADGLSNKGFVFTELDIRGTPVYVVGTHVQADDPVCLPGQAASIRASQFRQMDAFLDARRIPADRQVIVTGDLNVNRYGPEYTTMLKNLGVAAPDQFTGHRYSYDPATNSITADRDSPFGTRQQLDYVLHRNGHAPPADWANNTQLVHSPEWTVPRPGGTSRFNDYSDHYPVTGAPIAP
ncbi:sphingomyelin phosphodiesterase [Streptomyces sp. 7N604]|uniref:sphingomyelin phosphodiesterase n=1 Tax=Streptomyces sp. 7N604 TaxID=3457415 RepID=UPI003FD0E7B0